MDYIKNIGNKKIDKVIAGGSNGSIILFDLVDDLAKKSVLYVYCAWRLSLNNKVLTGSNDDSEASKSVFVVELKKLENDIIKKVFSNPLGDFTLEFNSGKKLDVFSDITSNGDKDDIRENWVVCSVSENVCYNFTNRFDFNQESYK